MSIVAAKCPVCGRDIGFEETAEEYVCIFCGAKLMTSALKSEHVNRVMGGEPEKKPMKKPDDLFGKRPNIVPPRADGEREQMKKPEPVQKAESKDEPELTEEEIKHELERKVGFKEELRQVVKQIDELRGKRDPLKNKLKTLKTMSMVGLIGFGVVVIAAFILLDGNSVNSTYVLLGASLLGLIAGFMFVFSLIRRKETEKEQKRLEKTISEKKQKRDVLIGRLNKINKKLHIHHDD